MLDIQILKQILHNWFINYVIMQYCSWPEIYVSFFKFFARAKINLCHITYRIYKIHIFNLQFIRIRVHTSNKLLTFGCYVCGIYVHKKGKIWLKVLLKRFEIRNRCNPNVRYGFMLHTSFHEDKWKEECVSTAFFFQKAFQYDLNGGHASID